MTRCVLQERQLPSLAVAQPAPRARRARQLHLLAAGQCTLLTMNPCVEYAWRSPMPSFSPDVATSCAASAHGSCWSWLQTAAAGVHFAASILVGLQHPVDVAQTAKSDASITAFTRFLFKFCDWLQPRTREGFDKIERSWSMTSDGGMWAHTLVLLAEL
jgi:hypothetical protein